MSIDRGCHMRVGMVEPFAYVGQRNAGNRRRSRVRPATKYGSLSTVAIAVLLPTQQKITALIGPARDSAARFRMKKCLQKDMEEPDPASAGCAHEVDLLTHCSHRLAPHQSADGIYRLYS